jgi:ferredoxin-NADP reductase
MQRQKSRSMNPSPAQTLESMLAGMAAGTIAAFAVGSLALGTAGARGGARQPAGLLSTLVGTGLGAIAALVLPRFRSEAGFTAPAVDHSMETSAAGGWKDWRSFKVVRKVRESEEITSFHLEPVDGGTLPGFRPGQFLTIRLAIPGQPRPVIRTYSLSAYLPEGASSASTYRLSIKREPAPKDLAVPPGVASNFMHDHIQEGSIIEARPPSGTFVLDLNLPTAAVLISNGVGITPMMAMIKAAAHSDPKRKLWFFHGARDGRFHAFREEVASTAGKCENMAVHFAYSRPRLEDQGNYQSEGYVDAALIGSKVKEDADYFICGSPPFLEAIRTGLMEQGVPTARIRFEMFSKAPKPESTIGATAHSSTAAVTFARSSQTVPWRDEAGTLLEFAEANGLTPDYSCRAGVCGTCECRLLEGEVSYDVEPTAAVAPGSVLICIARPNSDQITLDL